MAQAVSGSQIYSQKTKAAQYQPTEVKANGAGLGLNSSERRNLKQVFE